MDVSTNLPTAIPPPDPTIEAYSAWQVTQSPDDLNRVVTSVEPAIQARLGGMNAADNPKLKAHARLLAAQAVKTYDPTSPASLRSWVTGNLQSLQRQSRAERSPGQVPERAQLDAWHLHQTEKKFIDENGYEPDVKELADFAHMDPKRISKVRRLTRSVGSQATTMIDPAAAQDYLSESMDYVYDESDKTDRQIIEMLTGYGGRPVFNKQQIAAALRLDPAQVTRRSQKISNRIQELESAMETTY